MAKSTKKLQPLDYLGAVVTDQVSKYKGTVTAIVWMLSGSIQANVQPVMGKDGKMPDTWSFDLDRLVVGKAGPVKMTKPDDTSHIVLGSTAMDKITKTVGVLTEKAVYLNGCTHFILTAEAIKKEERVLAVDWKRLDLTGSKEVMPTQGNRSPARGGPSRLVER